MANLTQEQVTFNSKRFKQTLHSHKEVLDKYYSGFDDAVKLNGASPIFLDTNVLLRIYSTSFKAREKFKSFLTDYKDRIILTNQVQWEFIKNRESVINKFYRDVTQELPSLFYSSILNPISSFIEINKTVTKDYDKIEKGLDELSKLAKKLADTISSEVSKSNVSSNSIIYQDEFITILQGVKLLDPLGPEVIKILKTEYNDNINGIEKADIEKQAFKCFPGCAEKKEKLDDPYGDYIIFHEILQYCKSKKCDAIFLTYDTSKGDWMQTNRNPHLHYVDNFYLNTHQLIYILDAERTLNDLLDINFRSLIKKDQESNVEISEAILDSFLNNYHFFEKISRAQIKSYHVDELNLNKIYTIEHLNSLLDSTANIISLIMAEHTKFNRIGLLRGCLKVINPNYKQINSGGTISADNRSYDLIRKKWLNMNL